MEYRDSIMNRIADDICKKNNMDLALFYKRTEMLLSSCRSNHKNQLMTFDSEASYLFDVAGTSLLELLERLRLYLKDQDREIRLKDIKKLIKSGWMASLIRNTMDYLRCLPDWGIWYAEILEAVYFSGIKIPSNELMGIFDMDETSFFKRKREAVKAFGVILIEKTLPHLAEVIEAEMARIVRESNAAGLRSCQLIYAML